MFQFHAQVEPAGFAAAIDDLSEQETVWEVYLDGAARGDRLSYLQPDTAAGYITDEPGKSGLPVAEQRDPNSLISRKTRLAPLVHASISSGDTMGIRRNNKRMATKGTSRKSGPAPKLDKGGQLERVRRICVAIPGTFEKLSHGEPTFFTPERVFAMFSNNHHGDGHVAVWLPAAPGVQTELIAEAPEIYFRPPYVGPSGWVGVELTKVDDEQLGALIREAHRVVNAKAQARSARRPSGRTS